MNEISYEILRDLKKIKPRFNDLHLKRVRVIGSVARGEAGPDSDVDLLIEFDQPVGAFTYLGAKHAIEDALGRKVDFVEPDFIFPELKDCILKEARDV